MKPFDTLAALAVLTTLAACGEAEAPAEVTVSEAVETEAANADVAVTELGDSADDRVEATAPAADSK
jgi:predicted small lipoprotein YifL